MCPRHFQLVPVRAGAALLSAPRSRPAPRTHLRPASATPTAPLRFPHAHEPSKRFLEVKFLTQIQYFAYDHRGFPRRLSVPPWEPFGASDRPARHPSRRRASLAATRAPVLLPGCHTRLIVSLLTLTTRWIESQGDGFEGFAFSFSQYDSLFPSFIRGS